MTQGGGTRGGQRGAVAAAVTAAALVAVGLLGRFAPALALAATLAIPAAEPWLARPLVAEGVWLAGCLLEADLYRPAAPRGALLLVHGLSRQGREHPELRRLARLLAARGQAVLVPHVPGLAAFRLGGREVDEVACAAAELAARHGRVGVAGLSFGAGPALLAAARTPGLRLVGSFGGYADLRHVIRFVTTGTHAFAGRTYVQPFEEYNRWKLLALLVGFVEDAVPRGRLEALVERKLADPARDTGDLEAGLGPDGRALLALARNRRPDAVEGLLAALPARARAALDRLSPLPVMRELPGRILIAHGAGDASIPFTESLRLAAATGGRASAVILESFHHVGPRPVRASLLDRLVDGGKLVGLADALLAD